MASPCVVICGKPGNLVRVKCIFFRKISEIFDKWLFFFPVVLMISLLWLYLDFENAPCASVPILLFALDASA